jgi:glycosyltransferase involved in cell wall biosynthesis
MKILYDHQTFSNQKYGGISRYFAEIMQYLYKEKISFDLSLLYSENMNLMNRDYFQNLNQLGNLFIPEPLEWLFKGSFPGKGRLFNLVHKGKYRNAQISELNQDYSFRTLQINSYNVFHPTYYHDYYLPIVKKKVPVVLTVYDMIHEFFSKFYLPTQNEYATKANSILTADKIIAISNSTKNDLINYLGVQSEKIEVIHLASSLLYYPEKDQNENKDYILFVGNRDGYKNFIPFIKSIVPIFKKFKINLVCAGGNIFSKKERLLFKSLEISDYLIHIPFQDDFHLASLYKKALFFVFPSLYEGFGIPLLEAMNIGCPVVCSNTSSFPEVTGDACEYFDPNKTESIFTAVKKILESESYRKILSQKGIDQSKKFSWDKTAKRHIELYKSIS